MSSILLHFTRDTLPDTFATSKNVISIRHVSHFVIPCNKLLIHHMSVHVISFISHIDISDYPVIWGIHIIVMCVGNPINLHSFCASQSWDEILAEMLLSGKRYQTEGRYQFVFKILCFLTNSNNKILLDEISLLCCTWYNILSSIPTIKLPQNTKSDCPFRHDAFLCYAANFMMPTLVEYSWRTHPTENYFTICIIFSG